MNSLVQPALHLPKEGRYQQKVGITRDELKLPWREAGPPNHLNDKVDSDQYVVNEELSFYREQRDGSMGIFSGFKEGSY